MLTYEEIRDEIEISRKRQAICVSRWLLRKAIQEIEPLSAQIALHMASVLEEIDKLAGPGERVRPLGRDEITTGICEEVNRRKTDQ